MSRPLVQKLGIRGGDAVHLRNAPPRFEDQLEPLPEGVSLRRDGGGPFQVAVLFARDEAELRRDFAVVAPAVDTAGALWVTWPKKVSGVVTDLAFDRVQAVGLEAGWVDNKICAVDEIWSGLRFVIRLADRSGRRRT
jgi:hypothetical protein